MKLPSFFLFILISTSALCQSRDSIFVITEGILTDSAFNQLQKIKEQKLPLYEDDLWIVTGTCSGEWGGSVWFKSKTNGMAYACEATCPVSVNKLHDKYYVSYSLSHLQGHCGILEIANPQSMEIFKMPKPHRVKGKNVVYAGDNQSRSSQGTIEKYNTGNVTLLCSFIYNDELFHVIRDTRGSTRYGRGYTLLIKEIEISGLSSAQVLLKEDTLTYENSVIKLPNNHLMIPIKQGYLDIYENRVVILRNQ